LAVAVFLDAPCIRLVVLPVVLRLTGHGAWYTPRWLAKALPDVRFSH
jgi:RND superfamily putative drug exporter